MIAADFEPITRLAIPALDAILGKPFKVLNDGFVRIVDYMGSDAAIVQAARVSYGKGTKKVHEDRGLIRFLMRQRHSTPFEMCELKLHVRVPMDHWRQWIRHRTACLSGDTVLHFDIPGGIKRRGNQLHPLTVGDVFQKFQPTANTQRPDKQRDPFFKRKRVQAMALRSLDEDTQTIRHTRIIDIWETGVKPVYRVTLANGGYAKMSADHLCLTDQGWLTLKDLASLPTPSEGTFSSRVAGIMGIGPGQDTGVASAWNPIDEDTEEWLPVVGWEDYYEVSDQGRVRRILGGRGSRSFGRCKKLTVSNAHAVVSMNRPGTQVTELVHRLVLEAFVGPSLEGMQGCHNDGNGLNNDLANLRWDSAKGNASDRVRDGATTGLHARVSEITLIEYGGEEMTYDLEVEGPHRNFSANGLVVHNSVNEYSTRYSEAIDSIAKTAPEEWRLQSGGNRQGSDGCLEIDTGALLTAAEEAHHQAGRDLYEERLKHGVAKEQARKDLSLSTYTEAYWKIDLHNLLHFLGLRMDSHAQKEIRDYATVIGEQILAPWCPVTWEAFQDYRMKAMYLTRLDIEVMTAHLNNPEMGREAANLMGWLTDGKPEKKNRERGEFEVKMARLGIVPAWCVR